MVSAQSLGTACALCWFGAARTPLGAACGLMLKEASSLCYGTGVAVNYLEVGGQNTALLKAVGNTLANVPGWLIPLAGVWLRRLTPSGSWLPLFCGSAALHVVAGLHFLRRGAVVSALADDAEL